MTDMDNFRCIVNNFFILFRKVEHHCTDVCATFYRYNIVYIMRMGVLCDELMFLYTQCFGISSIWEC